MAEYRKKAGGKEASKKKTGRNKRHLFRRFHLAGIYSAIIEPSEQPLLPLPLLVLLLTLLSTGSWLDLQIEQ